MTNYSDQYLNKRNILDRMRRFAAGYFGVSQADLLDPIVRLFLESVAEEIYKIANEIDDMENRIQSKLSGILISDIDSIAKPAHTIIHATPSVSKYLISDSTAFHHTPSHYKGNNRLSFYPVCNTTIYKGDIRYFIHKGLLYSIDNQQTKTLLTRSGQRESFSANSFWIGLELDDSIKNIKDLSFYFDFIGVYEKQECLNKLPYTVWEIQDKTVPMSKGLSSIDETYENDTLELFSKYDFSNKINSSVKNKCDLHYLSVSADINIDDKRENFPTKLKDSFSANFIEGFEQPLVWIEIICPNEFTSDIIESIQVSINTFPVVNKKMIAKTIELNRSVPIIPLNTGNNESFISVCSLIDSKGRQYYDIPINDAQPDKYGIYSSRQGGCERYSIREAREYLINTIDSLSKEISAFFENKEDVKTELKKIQADVSQIIKDLSNTISKAKERYDVENYILIDPETSNDELFFLEYWVTTTSDTAIKTGAIIKSESGLPIDPSSMIMLTSTKDGKYAPGKSEIYKQYKKSLTKHNLLVTSKDIKQFCINNFQDSITEVEIRKGLIENSDIGFIKTTDVYLRSRKELEKYLGERDEEVFCRLLTENSPATFRYRVFINKVSPD